VAPRTDRETALDIDSLDPNPGPDDVADADGDQDITDDEGNEGDIEDVSEQEGEGDQDPEDQVDDLGDPAAVRNPIGGRAAKPASARWLIRTGARIRSSLT
jgi:hypothetical protein